MKNMIKNTLSTIKRFPISTLLNIIGLTIAFVAAMLIMIKVYSEYQFDSCHPNANRIYKLTTNSSTSVMPRPFVDAFIKSSPYIEAGTIINPYISENYFLVGEENVAGYKEKFITCNEDITKTFNFKMVEGESDCLSDPNNILIPESMALRFFGNKSAIGQQIQLMEIMWTKQAKGSLTVGGVYRDFPENTQVENCIYTKIADDNSANDWLSSSYNCFIMLTEGALPEDVMTNFNNTYNFDKIKDALSDPEFKLTPLRDIYFSDFSPMTFTKTGNPSTPKILSTVAILIIIIALINYMNLNMALVPARMKKINICKVLGASNTLLRISVLLEGMIISLISFILAVFIIFCLYKTNVLDILNVDINPLNNIGLMLVFFVVAFAIGVIASLRTAYYTTSLPPAMAIKGNLNTKFSNKGLRNILIGFQFVISIILIIFSIFISKQNAYMQKYTLGYDTENIVIIEPGQSIMSERYLEFVNKLKANPNIMDIAHTWYDKLGSADTYATWGVFYNSETVVGYSMPVSWYFLKTMGIKIIEGREPQEQDEGAPTISFIINKAMQQNHNIKVGDILDVEFMGDRGKGTVLGIIDNIKIQSLRATSDENMFFVLNWSDLPKYVYVKIRKGSDLQEVTKHIENTVAEIDPNFPANTVFYDTIFNNLYKKEIEMGASITLFSILSIIISLIGVFGLVMFECKAREKEVSIRKVLGSSEQEVVKLLNTNYMKILAISIVIAIPASYYVVSQWLTNFAYKTSMDWWVFLLASAIVPSITLVTVTIQTYRVATQNPVDSLKNE